MAIYKQSKTEKALGLQIQKAVRYEISRRNYDEKILAEKLNLLPVGVKNLLEFEEWPLYTAIRVAEALCLVIRLDVCHPPPPLCEKARRANG
jgi:hypothetical protein